ncbi:MAG TPA: UvrD-helicase domain-containing protein, partial [Thermoanaerobaculia bacterium]
MSGERSALRAADHAARRLAQSEFVRPLVLEAGAGTGKTTALVARLLAWCLGPGWERAAARRAERAGAEPDPNGERTAAALLAGVVAITFTEAAAAEMAERAGRELTRLAAGGEPPEWLAADLLPPAGERTRRARALAATLDRLTVRTIHAFCRGLLADHPLEAGLHPAFTVDADGLALEEVVRETVEPALRRAYEDEADSDLLRLAARGIPPQQVADALTLLHLHAVSAEELAGAADPGEEAAALVARFAVAVAPLAPLVAAAFGGDSRPNTKALRAGLARLAKELDRLAAGGRLEPSAAEAAFFGADERESAGVRLLQRRLAALLPENLLAHLRKLAREAEAGKPALPDAEREALRRHTDELCRLARHLATLDPELLAAARGALAPLLAEVERGMRARGAVTYDGLLEGAVELLARHAGVRARLRRGIDQLLVDEFQDTDRVQCELLRWLALDGPVEERPGLFLVGDPKQSIYGWRSADLAAYDAFVAAVRAAGGEVRPLAENFRSVPAVLEEVTRIVEPVLRERTGVQPRFEPLLACERLAGSA